MLYAGYLECAHQVTVKRGAQGTRRLTQALCFFYSQWCPPQTAKREAARVSKEVAVPGAEYSSLRLWGGASTYRPIVALGCQASPRQSLAVRGECGGDSSLCHLPDITNSPDFLSSSPSSLGKL